MGPLRLVLEVLFFTSCTLCCEFDSLWLTSTLGLALFGFDSQEATTVFFFWNLDFKIPNSGFNRLWGTGFDLFKILIFGVLELEFVIALGLEFFGFEMILALELEASGYDWTTVSNLAPLGTQKVFTTCFKTDFIRFPFENPISLPLFL